MLRTQQVQEALVVAEPEVKTELLELPVQLIPEGAVAVAAGMELGKVEPEVQE